MSKRTPLTFTPENKGSRPPAAVQETAAPNTTVRSKGRQGRQFIAAHVVPEAAKQFKLLAVQQDRTTQDPSGGSHQRSVCQVWSQPHCR